MPRGGRSQKNISKHSFSEGEGPCGPRNSCVQVWEQIGPGISIAGGGSGRQGEVGGGRGGK